MRNFWRWAYAILLETLVGVAVFTVLHIAVFGNLNLGKHDLIIIGLTIFSFRIAQVIEGIRR